MKNGEPKTENGKRENAAEEESSIQFKLTAPANRASVQKSTFTGQSAKQGA